MGCLDTLLCRKPLREGRSRHYVASRGFDDSCVFCRIVSSPPSDKCRVVYQNERLVVFPDIRPSAVQHLLVVPREHVANTDSLDACDLSLVQEMREVGEKLLRERSKPDAALKFGYHVPPWRSVDHLHLHCFELPHTPPFKVWKYWLPCVWLDSDGLVERLQERARDL